MVTCLVMVTVHYLKYIDKFLTNTLETFTKKLVLLDNQIKDNNTMASLELYIVLNI